MRMLSVYFYIILLFLSSAIVSFLATYYMIKHKNIKLLLPLLILGISGILKTSFTFFQIHLNAFFGFVEILGLFAFFLILINIRRKFYDNY